MSALAPQDARDWRTFLLVWALAMLMAVAVDHALASWLAPHFFAMKINLLARGIEHIGRPWFLLLVLLVLLVLHPRHWRAVLFVFCSSLFGAMLGALLKWLVGRTRPVADMQVDIRPFDFDSMRGGLAGLAEQSNLSFPSGHAIQVVSMAACLSLLYPRLRHLWWALALLVMGERVLELAHYPSDVVAGSLFGVLAFALSAKFWRVRTWLRPAAVVAGATTAKPGLDKPLA